MTDKFKAPEYWEPYAVRRAAADAMNAVELTVDQFELGMDVYQDAQAYAAHHDPARYRERALAALEDFCAGENLLPADVAAAAILTRHEPIHLALGDCVDLKTEFPDTYLAYILEPIEIGEPEPDDVEEAAG